VSKIHLTGSVATGWTPMSIPYQRRNAISAGLIHLLHWEILGLGRDTVASRLHEQAGPISPPVTELPDC